MSTAVLPITERIIDCEQGSPEWWACRLGCVTSSRIAPVVKKRQRGNMSEELSVRTELRMELLYERLSGKPSEHYVSKFMEEGREREPLARVEYEMLTGNDVEQIGFIYHPTLKWSGASPDGLIGADGLIEIKCPKYTTHLQYIVDDVVPEEYQPQMLWQMACTERSWCDFVSYHPDIPEPYHLFVKRFERNEALIRGYETDVQFFLQQLEEAVQRFKK